MNSGILTFPWHFPLRVETALDTTCDSAHLFVYVWMFVSMLQANCFSYETLSICLPRAQRGIPITTLAQLISLTQHGLLG